MLAGHIPVRPGATADRWWRRLCPGSRFPSRTGSVNRTGLDGRPVPVEQEAAAGPALLLLAGQLAEPFRARA